jgi:hypothetical protein
VAVAATTAPIAIKLYTIECGTWHLALQAAEGMQASRCSIQWIATGNTMALSCQWRQQPLWLMAVDGSCVNMTDTCLAIETAPPAAEKFWTTRRIVVASCTIGLVIVVCLFTAIVVYKVCVRKPNQENYDSM